LYPATDGQQTGNNVVADTRNMLMATGHNVADNLLPGNMLPWCKRGLTPHKSSHFMEIVFLPDIFNLWSADPWRSLAGFQVFCEQVEKNKQK